jgi:hypothetical protein
MRNDRVDQHRGELEREAGIMIGPLVRSKVRLSLLSLVIFMGDVKIRQRLAAMSIFAFGLPPFLGSLAGTCALFYRTRQNPSTAMGIIPIDSLPREVLSLIQFPRSLSARVNEFATLPTPPAPGGFFS